MSMCECGADHAQYKTNELNGEWVCSECYDTYLKEEVFNDMEKTTQEIIQGDCLEVMKGFADKSFDLILTDPPYGIDYDPNWKTWSGEKQDKEKVIGDTHKFDPAPFLEKYENIILFGANNFSDLLPCGDWIIWDKRCDENKDSMVGNPFEMAWYRHSKVKGEKIYRILHGGVVNADSLHGNNQKRYHPTQKPVELFKRILLDFTEESDTILDPFLGSGTTLVACKQLNRNGVGIEISKEYCEIARKRLEQSTLL